MVFTAAHMAIIKATAPAVAANAETLTKTFYRTMFANDPQVLAFFNPAHQVSGDQPRALANAVVAYALNIDNLGALGGAVELMAVKHVALMIKPEHYAIVGKNLMLAIHEVLGAAVTQEVHDAWAAAYGQLADILIGAEKKLYEAQLAAPGGWNGWRDFKIASLHDEGEHVRSFELVPVDGKPVLEAQPGQYLSVHFDTIPGQPAGKPIAPRNYSITTPPGTTTKYRISVKKLEGGVVSTHLHSLKSGDVIQVGPPCGCFGLLPKSDRTNAVFISGGIGVTPLVSMAQAAAHRRQRVQWIQSGHGQFNFVSHTQAINNAASATYINTKHGGERLTSCRILGLVPAIKSSDVYVCGPREMVIDVVGGLLGAGVPEAQIKYEFFGPLAKITPATSQPKCPFMAAH